MKTITQVREAFWDAYFHLYGAEYKARKRQGQYSVDCRCSFVDFGDNLHRDGQITEKLARRVTL